jgi:hypothetical protein
MLPSSKQELVVRILLLSLLCCSVGVASQTSTPVDGRIRDFVIALFPKYSTADYQLSIEGQRMIGLNFPVNNWFFSLEPHFQQADVGYLYNPTSIPCRSSASLYPEGTCVKPKADQYKPALLGRVTFAARGAIAAEISRPEITDRNEKLRLSLPADLNNNSVETLLVTAGAKFPPSKQDSLLAIVDESRLASYLRVKPAANVKFCISQRSSGSSARTPAIYWLAVLAGPTSRYLAVFEPFEGDLTVLEPIRNRAQAANACVQ